MYMLYALRPKMDRIHTAEVDVSDLVRRGATASVIQRYLRREFALAQLGPTYLRGPYRKRYRFAQYRGTLFEVLLEALIDKEDGILCY